MSQQRFKPVLLLLSRHLISILIKVNDISILDDFFERRADFCFFAVVFHGYSYL